MIAASIRDMNFSIIIVTTEIDRRSHLIRRMRDWWEINIQRKPHALKTDRRRFRARRFWSCSRVMSKRTMCILEGWGYENGHHATTSIHFIMLVKTCRNKYTHETYGAFYINSKSAPSTRTRFQHCWNIGSHKNKMNSMCSTIVLIFQISIIGKRYI